MEGTSIYQWATFLLAPATAIVTWLAARKKRKNDNILELQETINILIHKNQELFEKILEQSEIIMQLKNSNAELNVRIHELEMQIYNNTKNSRYEI